MKLLALGDIHGRSIWKKIVEREKPDLVVFIGDYFDSHEDVSAREQLENFQDILNYKKEHGKNVVLIIGNHDFHYLDYTDKKYSGYQYDAASEIKHLLQQQVEEKLLQACFRHGNFIFSHAGITKSWALNHQVDLKQPADSINNLFKTKPTAFEFTAGPNQDPTGNDVNQTPLWVRPQSLAKDRIEGFSQVVGHTIQYRLQVQEELYFIDCLGTSGEYLVIQDGHNPQIGRLA